MTIESLTEELDIIDQTMAELDDRRTVIINRMADSSDRHDLPSNVLQFPGRVQVRRSSRGASGDWLKSNATAPDME
jgi:hypothetical protein